MSQQDNEEAVRRLLAQARHDGPTPDDVVARLDDVLAGLVAERTGAPQSTPVADDDAAPAPVIELAQRRSRRRLVGMVAAAASVAVLGGVALNQAGLGDADRPVADGATAVTQDEVPESAGGSELAEPTSGAVPETASGPTAKLRASRVSLSSSQPPREVVRALSELRRTEVATYSLDEVSCPGVAPLPLVNMPVLWDDVESLAAIVGARDGEQGPARYEIRLCTSGETVFSRPLR